MGWPRKPGNRKELDDNLKQARMQGVELTRSAKAIHKNYLKIADHSVKVAEAALGRQIDPPPGIKAPLHEILAYQHRVGAAISGARREMTAAEIRAHHGYLNKILPLVRQNAAHAIKLAECWTRMHESLKKIADMLNR